MRAVHVVTRFNVGGIARFLQTARSSVDVLVCGRTESGEQEAPWAGECVRINALRRAVHPLRDRAALLELTAVLRDLAPDVVHTHASKAGALGRLAARKLGVPAVHTFHGHVLEGYFARPVSWLFTRVERRLGRHSLVTATGPATARDLTRRLGVPVEVIPPGVALPRPPADARRRWRESLGNPERIALSVARPAAVKDLGRFVAASRAAGYLPVAAGTERIEGGVGLGTIDAIEELYAACDVVVAASRAEGTPYALLEAAWAGRPVVATPVGDVAWIVGDGGILTDDLAGALKRLRDPALRERLGARAAAAVRTRFPAPALAPRLRELYARALVGF